MEIVWEESLPLSRVDYSLVMQVTDDGMVIPCYPSMDIHLDDMDPQLAPDLLTELTAQYPEEHREIMGVIFSVMTLDEIEAWGNIGLRAAAIARDVNEEDE